MLHGEALSLASPQRLALVQGLLKVLHGLVMPVKNNPHAAGVAPVQPPFPTTHKIGKVFVEITKLLYALDVFEVLLFHMKACNNETSEIDDIDSYYETISECICYFDEVFFTTMTTVYDKNFLLKHVICAKDGLLMNVENSANSEGDSEANKERQLWLNSCQEYLLKLASAVPGENTSDFFSLVVNSHVYSNRGNAIVEENSTINISMVLSGLLQFSLLHVNDCDSADRYATQKSVGNDKKLKAFHLVPVMVSMRFIAICVSI